jgi:hypothetical protein
MRERIMRALLVGAVFVSLVLSDSGSACGGERLKYHWYKWKAAYRANLMWPQPYLEPDRWHARAPFDVMVAKGWQEQNTLTDDHFLPGKAELSETGRLKVADILINSPAQFRTIYVERTWEGASTADRMRAVQEYAAQRLPEAGEVAVAETVRKRYGTSAEYTDNVLRQFQASQPVPRLPSASVSGYDNDTTASGS